MPLRFCQSGRDVFLGYTPVRRCVTKVLVWTLRDEESYGRVTVLQGGPHDDRSVALRWLVSCSQSTFLARHACALEMACAAPQAHPGDPRDEDDPGDHE